MPLYPGAPDSAVARRESFQRPWLTVQCHQELEASRKAGCISVKRNCPSRIPGEPRQYWLCSRWQHADPAPLARSITCRDSRLRAGGGNASESADAGAKLSELWGPEQISGYLEAEDQPGLRHKRQFLQNVHILY